MSKEQKFLDAKGVEVLWKQIDLNDYPNNETLIAVLNAIDETKADKNEIKQSDWNQSDESSADYIKNRTHYEEIVETGEATEVYNGSVTNRIMLNVITYDFGEMLYVTFDGVKYKLYGHRSGLICSYTSNEGDIPFYVNHDMLDQVLNFTCKDSGTHMVLIEIPVVKSVVHKLDSKFIPDSVVKKDYLTQQLDSSKSDWNQSDETAVDYIKNKPFYEDARYTVAVDEITVNCSTVEGNGYLASEYNEYVREDLLLNSNSDSKAFLWDGTMYDVETDVATYGNQQYIYCGNAYLLGISDQDTGLPFCVRVIIDDYVQVAGINIYARTQGNHTIALYAKSSVVKTIDEKYLPDSVKNENIVHLQSDWNQSDEWSDDYIKNKPFYEETIETGDVETLYEGTYTFAAMFSLPKVIYNDVLYVTFNEENYTLTRHDINPIEWDYHSTDGTELPFSLYYDGLENEMYFDIFGYEFTTDKVDVLIEAPVIETVVHQLNEKFIPDTIARTSDLEEAIDNIVVENADWNTTDETAASFIKNKPFGEIAQHSVLIDEKEIECYTAKGNGYYTFIEDEYVHEDFLLNGEGVSFLWDGVMYDVEPTYSPIPYYGNGYLFNSDKEDNGLPFCVTIPLDDSANVTGIGVYAKIEGNHTIALYEQKPAIKTIDEKYIPETIARASNLNALVSRVTAAEGEIDTVNNKVDNHITNADIHFTTTERTKLASIDTDANKYIHPSYTERTGVPTANQTPGFGETFTVSQPVSDATGHITAINSRTITIPDAVATTNEAGLMSSDDKNKLETINIAYGICDTASNIVEKIITLIDNDYWSLKRGAIIVVSFTNTNTAISPLFNVNGTGGIQVKYNNAVITSKNRDFAGYEDRTSIYMYDGTGYVFLGWSHYEKNTDTRVQQIALPTTGSYPMLLAAELTNNTSNYTSHVHKESKLYYNAHYETLYAPNIEGNLNGSATTLSEKLPIELGGTGATTPDGAVGNLKVMPQVSYNNTQYILGMDENGIFMVDYVNGFTFSIAGITYNSNYGMTWGEWVNSSYNTGGYVISGVDTVSNAEGKGVMGESAINAVMRTDLIVEGYAYTINTASSEPT